MIKSFNFFDSTGRQLVYLSSGQHKFLEITGLSGKSVKLQTPKGVDQQGVYYYGTNANSRVISLVAMTEAVSLLDLENTNRTILSILNAELGIGRIEIETTGGNKYIINATVAVEPSPIRISRTYAQTYDVIFECPKPDWLSSASTQMKMIDLVGGLTLPFTLPFILAEHGTGGIVDYTGDNPARLLFDFRVVSGGTSMSNPKVTNQNGDYIQITKTLIAGQKILVDTKPDAPSIIFEDTDGSQSDAWDTLVYGSTFFQLERGTNTFSFTATAGDPEVYITYNEQYAGV